MANELETKAINVIRGLAMDAVQKANSGHPGTAMALAPLAHVLHTRIMRYDATDPEWPDRDRFILSAGHASMLLYSMLYLTGFGLELEDMLFLAMACALAMLVGQFLFSDRYMFFLPMNWFLMLMVFVLGVPGLTLFKYGKPRGYLLDLVLYHAQPRSYCALARDTKLTNSFLKESE